MAECLDFFREKYAVEAKYVLLTVLRKTLQEASLASA